MALEPEPGGLVVGWCECCGSADAATYRATSADSVDFGPWRLCRPCRDLVRGE
jgi:hypothetical protein